MAEIPAIDRLLNRTSTDVKAELLRQLVGRIFEETEEVADLGIVPEDLWEAAFQLKVATEKYINVLHGRCPTCEPEEG